jgi:hypothetical protein
MRMYTCPDAYVIFPPAEPTVEDSENEQVMVIHKGTMKVKSCAPSRSTRTWLEPKKKRERIFVI